MTTTVPRAPAPPASPAAPAPVQPPATGSVLSRRLAASRASVRESFSGSPGRLRLLGAAAIAVSLLGGVLGAFALQQRAASLQQAQSDTAQLVRVQSIMTNLVQANADATNAYLVPGQEPPGQRVRYDARLAAAAAGLVQAARANAEDAERLETVNASLVRYSKLVEAARVTNSSGLPVGRGYIQQASDLIRSDDGVLGLARVMDSTADRVEAAYGRAIWWNVLLGFAGVLVVAGLVSVQISLARRSHRYLNVPVASGSLLLIIALVVGAVALGSAQSRADGVRDGAYRNTIALAQARIVGFDAKANESLSLINQGAGQSVYEPIIAARLTAATERLGSIGATGRDSLAALTGTDGWKAVDDRVRAADNANDRREAVRLATTTAEGGSNRVFDTFDQASRDALEAEASAATSELGEARPLLLILAAFLLLAGIVSAAASWVGLSVRLEEYR